MVKPRVYIETSILSYLTARPSRDLVQAAHQQLPSTRCRRPCSPRLCPPEPSSPTVAAHLDPLPGAPVRARRTTTFPIGPAGPRAARIRARSLPRTGFVQRDVCSNAVPGRAAS